MEQDAKAASEVEVLEYPACPGATATRVERLEGGLGRASGSRRRMTEPEVRPENGSGPASSESDRESARRSFEAGRERGREEGRQAEREAHEATLAAEAEQRRRQLGELVTRFAEERDRYLRAVEQEVVKLALAVAARILRREAQMDPLLLTGAVRVALGQLAASTEVRLRVPAAELELWTRGDCASAQSGGEA